MVLSVLSVFGRVLGDGVSGGLRLAVKMAFWSIWGARILTTPGWKRDGETERQRRTQRERHRHTDAHTADKSIIGHIYTISHNMTNTPSGQLDVFLCI